MPGTIAAYRGVMALPPLVEPTGPLSPTETARLQQVRNLPQLRLPPIDDLGHRRLAAARVLVLGTTGLSAPAVRSLAAAGVGTIGLADVGPLDVDALVLATTTILTLSPDTAVTAHDEDLTAESATRILGGYDLVIDGSDLTPQPFLVGDTCASLGLPLVWGSVARGNAEVSVFWSSPPRRSGQRSTRLRDFFGTDAAGAAAAPADPGVLGALRGQAGAILAAEAVRLITGTGEPLIGRVLTIDAESGRFDAAQLPVAQPAASGAVIETDGAESAPGASPGATIIATATATATEE
ncbi:HesA/MoeB/ThiF family protein [Cryobacterium sp. TMB3-1-2]|nr:HesA/MoeB/ThiF family protein [Cryobacterium sp. TMB3-1-2]TFC73747.1 HesA/MoeB/ThiF family protein [Cryobacterium sp. TMB3-15]TFC77720.1 HesA/MoeB/ThiF family protein [Cryobacterium sp. TMB3-10]TFD43026.1 HesA/MoeB/ThiF family protein [Cryobacterium sp. TMB3-12]